MTWQELAPLLDGAMSELRSQDRDAVVLRFFENKSLHEVSRVLGIEERAAQKRVQRSVDRLRRVLFRRGVTATGAALVAAISTHSIQAAPQSLVSTISATAMKGSTVAVSTQTLVKGTLKTMAWTKAKMAAGIAAGTLVAMAAAAAIIHHHQLFAGNNSNAQAHEAKVQAERSGGTVNLAGNPASYKPELDKAEAELKALRARKN